MNVTRYDTCFPHLTVEEAKQFQKNQTRALFTKYRFYFAWIPLPLVIIALLLTTVFAVVAYKAIRYRRVSRKCYIFVINRAIGDMLCCIFFLLCAFYLIVISNENFDVNIFIALVTFCGGCLWTAMTSYVCLSLLKLYAVYNPLNYRSMFSTGRCLWMIGLSWIVYALMILYTWTVIAISNFKWFVKWAGISASRSSYVMSRSKDIFFVVVYVITIIVFLLTVIFIRRGRKFVDTLQIGRNNSTSTRFPFWKLSLNVLIFAVVNFAFVYATFMTVFFQDSCYWRVNRDRRTKTIGLLRCALLARIIIDAIVGFVIDPQLRRVAANMFGFWRCVSTVKRKLTLSAISAGSSSATTDSRKDFPAARIKSISLTVSSQ